MEDGARAKRDYEEIARTTNTLARRKEEECKTAEAQLAEIREELQQAEAALRAEETAAPIADPTILLQQVLIATAQGRPLPPEWATAAARLVGPPPLEMVAPTTGAVGLPGQAAVQGAALAAGTGPATSAPPARVPLSPGPQAQSMVDDFATGRRSMDIQQQDGSRRRMTSPQAAAYAARRQREQAVTDQSMVIDVERAEPAAQEEALASSSLGPSRQVDMSGAQRVAPY